MIALALFAPVTPAYAILRAFRTPRLAAVSLALLWPIPAILATRAVVLWAASAVRR